MINTRIPPIPLSTGRLIGHGHPAYVIAEIGSNHDGDLERAIQLIHLAKEAGADGAKFQSFQAETLLNPICKSNGQWQNDPNWNVIEKLSLPLEWHPILQKEAQKIGIDFISTPFDLERLKILIKLDVPFIKIASGDLTYYELIRAAGESGKPVVLSTGHATLGEVDSAFRVLWESGCKDIVILHCASLYPASFEEANIRAMDSMQQGFQVLVGYSDHTLGITVVLGALALGACMIEKHLTDDKKRHGPDHSIALDGKEFTHMVSEIRHLEAALIGGTKKPRLRENEERVMARRAIYAGTHISKGECITREKVKIVRHCYSEGIPGDHWTKLEGCTASKAIEKDTLITWEMV